MLDAFDSYLYGLILSDGTIYETTRNRGRIVIELHKKDSELLEKIHALLPESYLHGRSRATNFTQHIETVMLSVYKQDFRDRFKSYGIPLKDKSIVGTVPNVDYVASAFWRGVYDGNGSIGMTGNNEPFVSLVIKSVALKDELLNLLRDSFGVYKNLCPNKRDHVYNIVLKNEDAISFANFLYSDAGIYMQRKYDSYCKILTWKRTRKKRLEKSWSVSEVDYIQHHSVKESVMTLGRSERSIKMKLWRLHSKVYVDKESEQE